MADFTRFRGRSLTVWNQFTRVPKKIENDQYVCILKGEEIFRLVSPIFRQNIYVGVFENLPPEDTPLNFFDVDGKG